MTQAQSTPRIPLILFLTIASLVLSVPLLMLTTGAPQIGRLSGKSEGAEPVPLSFASFIDGSFQKGFEKRFERRSGIWGALVRTDNQLNYFLFRQISTNYKTKVLLGRDNYLIERAYLPSATKLRQPNTSRMDSLITSLRTLQDLLKKRGIAFMLLISPSKPSFYPEIIPSWYTVPGAELRSNNYDYLMPKLAASGINYFDSRAFLKERAPSLPYPVFTNGGTHWSEFSGCLVTSELMERLGTLIGKPITQFVCSPNGNRIRPAGMDIDLLRLANLWFPQLLIKQTPKIEVTVTSPEHVFKPKVFIEGTSFCWSIINRLESLKTNARTVFYYYFNTRNAYPGRKKSPIDRNAVKWEEDVLASNVVMIEVNESTLHETGHDFIEALTQKLQ